MTEHGLPELHQRVNTSKEDALTIARKHGKWTGDVLKREGWSEERIGKFFGWLRVHPEFQKELMSARGICRVRKELEAPKPKKKKRIWRAIVFSGYNTCKG